MDVAQASATIEASFRQQVQGNPKARNAYLLVDSEALGVHLDLAAGTTEGQPADPRQASYMASVGKLFTATLIAILQEQGALAFDDPIERFLDAELMDGLHVHKGHDYSSAIQVRHLLNQTSGLYDNFWPLLEKLRHDPAFAMSPRDAVLWGKQNLSPKFPPGRKLYYTDTNYHLLGLIIEAISGRPFHEALREHIFAPLGMRHAHVLHSSDPIEPSDYPIADFYAYDTNFLNLKGYAGIDYAGGGVVAPMHDLLIFMKALASHQIIKPDTLEQMKSDKARFNIGIDYGYGIWQYTTIPLLLPKQFNAWGVVGATGAFMFHHPLTSSYIIGAFNDLSYMRKAIRFMFFKVIKPLTKLHAARMRDTKPAVRFPAR